MEDLLQGKESLELSVLVPWGRHQYLGLEDKLRAFLVSCKDQLQVPLSKMRCTCWIQLRLFLQPLTEELIPRKMWHFKYMMNIASFCFSFSGNAQIHKQVFGIAT